MRQVLLLVLVCVMPAVAAALEIPAPPATHVHDGAGWLSPEQERSLAAQLAQFERDSSNQLVVATFPSLDGGDLEDTCNRIAEAWKVGRGDRDNGILLAVFDQERKVRIEVGYGLEGAVTDLISHQIIQDEILPRFRAGQRYEGLEAGARALMAASRGEYEGTGRALGDREGRHRKGLPLGTLFWIAVLLWFILRGGRRGRGGRGGGPWIFWGGGFGGGGGSGFGGGGFGGGGFGGFSGGGGSFGGGGASGSW